MNPRAERRNPDRTAETPHRARLLDYLSLFTSLGTFLCCALPSLLLSAMPWLVTLARHQVWVFSVTGTVILADLMYATSRRARWTVGGVCHHSSDASGAQV